MYIRNPSRIEYHIENNEMKFLISFLYLLSFISVSYSLSNLPPIIDNNRVYHFNGPKEDNLGPIKEAFEEIVKDLLVFSKKIADTYKTKSVKDDNTSKANIVKAIQFHLRTINLIADEVDFKLLPLLQQASDKSKRPKKSPNVAAQWNGEIFWKHPSAKVISKYPETNPYSVLVPTKTKGHPCPVIPLTYSKGQGKEEGYILQKAPSYKPVKISTRGECEEKRTDYIRQEDPDITIDKDISINEKLPSSKSDYHAHTGRSKQKTMNYVSMSVSMKDGGKHSPPKSPLPLSPNPKMMAPRTMIYGP
uniref:Secreted protein n=1 Tax=Strongyloides papillosus TaxID=174720 RepID=A0A0N5B3U5_STREA